MRNTFIHELTELATQNEDIVLVIGDLGYSVVEPFADKFPDRFFNAGVAEQNMAGFAAGMASEGCHVFLYSIANFPTFRCAEQVRNDIAYHNLPVTIVSVGGGVAYGALGYSHHAVQDYALLRSMPNMLIAAPGDPIEVRSCLRYLVKTGFPSYLRLGKAGEPCFHDTLPDVAPGKWVQVNTQEPSEHKGSRTAVLTTGATLEVGMDLCQRPEFKDCPLFSMPLWGQSSKSIQEEQAAPFEELITLEDHLLDGGFGSWMMESLTLDGQAGKVNPNALSAQVCGTVGSQSTLNKFGGLGVIQRRTNDS